MKIDSVLKPKHIGWVSGAVLAVLLLIVLTRSGMEHGDDATNGGPLRTHHFG